LPINDCHSRRISQVPIYPTFEVVVRKGKNTRGIAVHPAHQVEQLTPRIWKQLFADDPIPSDLDLPIAKP
jgi:hypothetical protein